MTGVTKAILAVGLVALAAVLLRLVNMSREKRARQYPMLIVSVVYAVGGMVCAYLFYGEIRFEENHAWYGGEVLVWNLLIVAGFLVAKLLGSLILRFVGKGATEFFVENWYEYDADNHTWFLRHSCKNLQEAMKILTGVVAGVCGAVLAMGWCGGVESAVWFKVFPCAALVVTAEYTNFLCGYTKQEYFHAVSGDDINASGVGGYYKLRKVYEELFPSALLVSHTGSEYVGKQGATDLIARLCESEDPIDRNVGGYFRNQKKKDGLFDVDYISAASRLMHGRSVVIFNPFYRDLGEYIMLPMMDALIHDRKCLVIVGRNSLKDDVTAWVGEMLKDYSKTGSLWRVGSLGRERPDCEVGVMSFSQIYDLKGLGVNANFLEEVSFVVLVEPSKMIATSQGGLGIIVEYLNRTEKPAYCVCDHDTDGLVDTLSHVLQENITDVVAAPVPRSVYTGMGWDANGDFIRQRMFDKQTHYLGNGTELAAVALKNQVKHVTWYSAEKAPVQDIRWIAGQYYPQICRYAHLPNQQRCLDERISYSSNIWGSTVRREEFVIAEDEFCNLFATMRAYLTRGEEQSFVNVLAENYLLRDYMRYNRQLFMSDPKAIPVVAPQYAKTERNTVFRLILMMATEPVPEAYIAHELSLLGYDVSDVYRMISVLIRKYTFVEDAIVTLQNRQLLDANLVPITTAYYSIAPQIFDENFAGTLKNAVFVLEDEKFDTEFIDAKMFEHITQTVMPGQFLTCGGKYYRVHAVSPELGCILRRASDSYTGRLYYRQLRTYRMGNAAETIRARKIMDVGVSVERRNFRVTTTGYLEMQDNHDLKSARVVDLSEDPCISAYDRSYKNKPVISLRLPESDEQIRFTVCLLMNEIFRTLFPDSWQYLAVLSTRPADVEGMLDRFIYRLDDSEDQEIIYIVEDSDMDLGLLEAVENNLMRIFRIMADYLNWHFEKIKESPRKDPVIPAVHVPEEEKRKKSFLTRLWQWLARVSDPADLALPGKKKPEKKTDEDAPVSAAEPAEPTVEAEADPFEHEGEETVEETLVVVSGEEVDRLKEDFDFEGETPRKPSPDQAEEAAETRRAEPEDELVIRDEDEDLFEASSIHDDLDLLMRIEQSRYQKECFLKFGFEEIDARLQLENVYTYLKVRGWDNNALTKARKREGLEETFIDVQAENHCDFCGMPLTGVSYERLGDGRTRCNDCASSAINQVSEFRELFRRTELMMGATYSIKLPVTIAVRVADARTIARHSGMVFRPSVQQTARVLGFAQRKHGKYSLFIENGSPRLAAIDTTTHELTHIWQYLNWKDADIRRIYAQSKPAYTRLARDIVYEGMAVWASIQMLYAMGETYYARQQETIAERREDVYGIGFILYRDRYGMVRNGEAPVFTPFADFPPIDPAELKKLFEEDE